ncbi:MAG TPA: phosphoenolpyruvate--protein phosphotransferase [Burkholderiales bacterium]|nr:phosphoenolpyruvate--protein phosphotransferase [Burkholderiales bacterium]
MSFTLHGAGAGGGIAIGHAHLISSARLEVAHYTIPAEDLEIEVMRFSAAVDKVRAELEGLRRSVPADAPNELGAFLNLHLMMLDDATLSHVPRALIRSLGCNAEWALVQQMDYLVGQFEKIDDPYLRERKADVTQVVERLLKAMQEQPARAGAAPAREHQLIVVAHELSPADMMLFKQHQYAGFVTDLGGVTSHTAILARSLGIPAIVGVHSARQLVSEGEVVIVDGVHGVLIVDPDPLVLEEYQKRQRELESQRQKLKRIRSTPATTRDGTAVDLHANIELPQDIEQVRESGATGVGLFRSEFLFLNRDDLPSEDEQFEAYRHVAQAMRGMPVTIRTLDLGADKTVNGAARGGPNPAMGLRAIRLCLAEPQMFLTQLRAILRASHYGKIRLLIPMLAHAHEIEQALAMIAQAKQFLDEQKLPYDRGIEVGGMIEVPAAALALGVFVRKLDFLSIGTNDLIQYTLAIDRTDDSVSHLYNPLHPAVLHLVAHTIKTSARMQIPVAVCGEMAGDVALTRLLLGFGLRQFSMHPASLLAVKQQVLKSELGDLARLAGGILRADDPEKAKRLLDKLNA